MANCKFFLQNTTSFTKNENKLLAPKFESINQRRPSTKFLLLFNRKILHGRNRHNLHGRNLHSHGHNLHKQLVPARPCYFQWRCQRWPRWPWTEQTEVSSWNYTKFYHRQLVVSIPRLSAPSCHLLGKIDDMGKFWYGNHRSHVEKNLLMAFTLPSRW